MQFPNNHGSFASAQSALAVQSCQTKEPCASHFLRRSRMVARSRKDETNGDEIRHQDCIEGLNSLPADSIDLVFADPPFNIGYEYDTYDDRQTRDDYLAWCRRWTEAVYRGLKSSGTFWLAI